MPGKEEGMVSSATDRYRDIPIIACVTDIESAMVITTLPTVTGLLDTKRLKTPKALITMHPIVTASSCAGGMTDCVSCLCVGPGRP